MCAQTMELRADLQGEAEGLAADLAHAEHVVELLESQEDEALAALRGVDELREVLPNLMPQTAMCQ